MNTKLIPALLALAFSASLAAGTGTTVKLAIGDWSPYTSPTDKSGKLAEVIVTEAFKQEGLDVEYTYNPWKRSFDMTKDGEADGTFPWTKTPDRINDFYFGNDIILQDDSVFFHLKTTKFEWSSLDDLKKYRVGVTAGYKEVELYKTKGIKAEEVADEPMNFKKILAGHIDVYKTSKIVGYATINKLFKPEEAKQFTNDPKTLATDQYYVLFSKKSPNGKLYSEKFDSGLKKLKASGQYTKIMREFFTKQ